MESPDAAFSGCCFFLCSLALHWLLLQIRGHWGGLWNTAVPALSQNLVLRCVQQRGNCSWFVTGPVFVVTEMAPDFPVEQLRLLFLSFGNSGAKSEGRNRPGTDGWCRRALGQEKVLGNSRARSETIRVIPGGSQWELQQCRKASVSLQLWKPDLPFHLGVTDYSKIRLLPFSSNQVVHSAETFLFLWACLAVTSMLCAM